MTDMKSDIRNYLGRFAGFDLLILYVACVTNIRRLKIVQ